MELPAWTKLLSQRDRLIEIETALPQAFVVERFRGREAVSESFVFEVDCLSADAFLDLRPLIGQELTLRLCRADGGQRAWHGYCTETMNLGSEGGMARYRLRLESWLSFLRLRHNLRIQQDQDERGVLERLFTHYPQASYRFDVTQALHRRPIRTQHESDFDYLVRLLAEAGLSYHFEHAQQDAGRGREEAQSHAQHMLVITDARVQRNALQPAELRYHRANAAEHEDAIVQFTEQRQVTPGAVTVASWQAEQLRAQTGQASADKAPVAGLEIYQATRAGVFPLQQQAEEAADLRLHGLSVPARLHAGAGNGRSMAAGLAFTLTQHPDLAGQRFVALAVEHEAANNLGSEAVQLLDASELEAGRYANRFVCVAEDVLVAPVFVPRPTAPGPQTARVVGLSGSAVTSDRDHRVRVQFWWQRGAQPLPGGMTDTGSSADAGHAPGDATSGFWVPLAEWSSGPNFGSHFVPRVGSDVLIDFAHGDLDQPVLVGQLYTGRDLPPFAAGVDSAANHPGVISGLQTQGMDGEGRNRWIVDDATGQLRHQIDTTVADSALVLGRLIEQDGASRGALRGEGVELRTKGWAIQRAGDGFLLSSSARPGGVSTQMDTAEAVSQWQAAVRTAKVLSDAAAQAQAVPLAANEQQELLLDLVDPAKRGRYDGAVNGQSAKKPTGDARDGGDPVERFAEPLIVQEGPSHLAWTTANSALVYAGQAQHWTVQSDAQFTAGATFSAVAGTQAGWVALAGPVQAIAGNGPVSMQSHTNTLDLLADQSVTITSTSESVEVLANNEIVLQAGQSRVSLRGGDIVVECPEHFRIKASTHVLMGGEADGAELDDLPHSLVQLKSPGQEPMPFSLRWQALSAVTAAAAEAVDVIAVNTRETSGAVLTMQTAGDGRTERLQEDRQAQEYDVYLGSGDWSMLWTGEDTPEPVESDDWMDWEAEATEGEDV